MIKAGASEGSDQTKHWWGQPLFTNNSLPLNALSPQSFPTPLDKGIAYIKADSKIIYNNLVPRSGNARDARDRTSATDRVFVYSCSTVSDYYVIMLLRSEPCYSAS